MTHAVILASAGAQWDPDAGHAAPAAQRGEWLWQSAPMVSWIMNAAASLGPTPHRVATGLAAMVDRLNPPQLDIARSSAVADDDGCSVVFQHRHHPAMRVDVQAFDGGEIVVSYGYEHEHFRPEDAGTRAWPFPGEDHIAASIALVESLLTGRIELHVWRRPFSVRTQSFWINDDGEPELFSRGGTLGPFFGWSQGPETVRFDYMDAAPA